MLIDRVAAAVALSLAAMSLVGATQPPVARQGVSGNAEQTTSSGEQIYREACVQCHGPNEVMLQRKGAEGWRLTVQSMVSRGARLLPEEIEPLTAYLAGRYGSASAPPSVELGQGRPQIPAGAGERVLVQRCSVCHAVMVITNSRKPAAEWSQTVARMQKLGARLTSSERIALVEYLESNFVPGR